MTDYDFGVNTLRFYFDASLLPSLGALISKFEEHPGTVASFGKSFRNLTQSKVKVALQTLAKSKGMSYPSRADINSLILDVGGKIDTVQVVKDAAADVGDGILGAIKWGSISLLVIAGVVAYCAFFTKAGRAVVKDFVPGLGK